MTSTYAAGDRSGTGILITPDRHITLGDHPCNRVPDVTFKGARVICRPVTMSD